jgi:hypothetical protein
MNNLPFIHILRFFLILLIQGLILKTASANVPYLDIYIYPIFIALLPIRTPHWVLILLGFIMGIIIDIFYDLQGVNAAVSVLTSFIRPFLCRMIEPRGGYDLGATPTRFSMGAEWYFQYIGMFMLLHLILLFTLLSFSFSSILLLRIFYGYAVSMLLIVIHSYLSNPKV